jgi:putative addiction module component (TIGR02574 family)
MCDEIAWLDAASLFFLVHAAKDDGRCHREAVDGGIKPRPVCQRPAPTSSGDLGSARRNRTADHEDLFDGPPTRVCRGAAKPPCTSASGGAAESPHSYTASRTPWASTLRRRSGARAPGKADGPSSFELTKAAVLLPARGFAPVKSEILPRFSATASTVGVPPRSAPWFSPHGTDVPLLPLSTAVMPRDILTRMGAKAEELMDEVLALPEDDRREFARTLLGKLTMDPSVLEAWYDEAERRWAEIERGEVETVPWEEVRQRVFDPR